MALMPFIGRPVVERVLGVDYDERFGMVFGMPVMQLLLFGYAINQDVRQVLARRPSRRVSRCA